LELRVREDLALRYFTPPGHRRFPLLGPLRAVLGTALLAVLHADGVERAADDVVANAGEILHAAAADEDHRVLLEVVSDAGNVARDFHPVREADTGHLAERGVRLLGRRRIDAGAHATLLRTTLEGG